MLMFRQDPAALLSGFDPDSICFIREAEFPLVVDPAYRQEAKNEAKMINPKYRKMSFNLFVLLTNKTYRTYKLSHSVKFEAELITRQRYARLPTRDRSVCAAQCGYPSFGALNSVFFAGKYVMQPGISMFGGA
jgi:hypothetical protein